MDFYVYVLFRPWSGSPCYVGKGRGSRWGFHEAAGGKHPNGHLGRVLAKAARHGLTVPKVKIREGLTEMEAFALETAFIKAIGRGKNGPLCNLTDGGEGVSGLRRPSTPEHRAKLSAALVGRKLSPEHRAKMSAAHTGKKRSPAATAKIVAARKGAKLSVSACLNIASGRTGMKHKPGTIEKLKASQARRWVEGRCPPKDQSGRFT